jgi:hypothetical protein
MNINFPSVDENYIKRMAVSTATPLNWSGTPSGVCASKMTTNV